MRTLFCIILTSFYLAAPALAADFQAVDLVKKKSVDSATFFVGRNPDSGTFAYIVDRTTGLCFARHTSGITHLDCDPLKKIPEIKIYIETGKLP